jgi:hypothetical protein
VVGFSAVGTDALDPPADVPFIFPHVAISYAPDMRNAYMQSWNLTLEHQLGEVVLRSAYVGTKGTALISGRDVNAPLANPTASTATTNERRPLYPNFARVALQEAVGNSSYHGLQLTGERRFNQGYTVLANYTWSKAIDNNVGSANKGGGTSVTNPLDQSFDRGTSNFDRTHVFNFSGLWEMPFHFENRLAQGFWEDGTSRPSSAFIAGRCFPSSAARTTPGRAKAASGPTWSAIPTLWGMTGPAASSSSST